MREPQSVSDEKSLIVTEQNSKPIKCYELGSTNPQVKVAVSMRDPGSANVLIPVINTLIADNGYSFTVFTDGAGAKILEKETGTIQNESQGDIVVEAAAKVYRSDIVLVGQSEDAGTDMLLTMLASGNGKPVSVGIEDFPGVVVAQNRGVLQDDSPVLIPDYQCVMSQWSKDNLLSLRPDLDPDSIVVTGSPAFDSLNLQEKEKGRKIFREKHGIRRDEKVIVWMGQKGESDSESLLLFTESLKGIDLDNYKLIIRRHPKDDRSNEFFEHVTSGIEDHLLDTTRESTDDVRRVADLVVTMFSTEGLKAVCEQTPTISIMVPEFLKMTNEDDVVNPIAEDGSAAIVRNPSEMTDVLKKVLFDEKFQEEKKQKMKSWVVDGKATERIIDLIRQIVGNKK